MKNEICRETIWDSTKGIAIISIFLVHNYILGNIRLPYDWMNQILSKGMYGVEITYIVNAYFFARNYDKRVRNGDVSRLSYLLKMILKIVPLYYCGLISVLVFEKMHYGKILESKINVLYHFLLIHSLDCDYFNTFFLGGDCLKTSF